MIAERAEHVIIGGNHIYARGYKGPTDESRSQGGLNRVGRLVAQSGLSMDGLLTLSLINAKQRGCHNEIIGLDIGSGNFRWAASVLAWRGIAPQARAFLGAHPDFRINLLGLTDSPSVAAHLQELPVKVSPFALTTKDKLINERIRARNIAYTLTASQTLEQFLQHQGINEIDFILAVNSLRFLSPNVFKEVVYTGVKSLRTGGRFIAYYFTGNLPWAAGGHNEGFNSAAARLTSLTTGRQEFVEREIQEIKLTHLMAVLNGNAPLAEERQYLVDEIMKLDPDEYKTLIRRGWDFYRRLGVLTEEEIKRVITEIDKQVPQYPPEQMLQKLARRTLMRAYYRFEKRERLKNMHRKIAIVQAIPELFPGIELQWIPYNRYELERSRDCIASRPMSVSIRAMLVWTHPYDDPRGGFVLTRR